MGLFLGYIGPLQVLLPNQAQDIDSADKALKLGIVTGIGAAVALVTGPAAGALSDATGSRFGRRRPWIAGGAIAGAAGLALLSGQHTILGVGLGYGVYASVDQALVTQVLPADADRAKDLGIINIANSAPQVLAPALAAPIVTYLGVYPVLFGTVAVATAAGSVFVTKIRSVR